MSVSQAAQWHTWFTEYRTLDAAENLGRFLVWSIQLTEMILILTVKMETRHSVEGSFGSEFQVICNHSGVLTA